MNILLLNWRDPKNPKAGGAEIVTMQHAKAWVKAGHRVVWFASQFENAKSKEIIDNVEIIRRGNSITVFLYAFFFYFFSKIKFDIVIDEIHGIPFFTPLFVRKPKIAFIHEVADEIWDYMYPFPINTIGRFLETFYLPLYRHVTLWTDALSTIEELGRFGFSKKDCYAISCPPENETLKKLPKKEKDKTFIFVSRVVRMKGVEEVIKAFAFISKEDKNAKLWIVGKGQEQYIKKLIKMTEEYGIAKNVLFFGAVTNAEKLSRMSKAHILLHASVKEGWGLVVVEAASRGTPSVVYDVPGLRDSVRDGKTGLIVKTNSPLEMAKEALLLLQNKKRYTEMQNNCLLWAKSMSWEKATKESLHLLGKVAYERIS